MSKTKLIKLIGFSQDFRTAQMADGNLIEFTKSEARALGYLASNTNKVVTREQILDAVSEPGSDKSDRNVDFLINRLRKKLNDSAKSPKFIASRYGEGYVWLSKWSALDHDNPLIFVVVGPIRGLANLPQVEPTAKSFARHLTTALQDECAADQLVIFDSDYSETNQTTTTIKPEYYVELTFLTDRNTVGCVAAVKSSQSSSLTAVARFALGSGTELHAETLSRIGDFATEILAKIWKRRAVRAEDVPLPVAMHDRIHSEEGRGSEWHEVDKRLRALRQSNPNDDELKLMYATHLHSKYVLLGPKLFYEGTDTCAKDEAEIERLVIDTLTFVETRPDFAIVSAKLLCFLQSGYHDLAHELAATAHQTNTKAAASLAIMGQLKAFQGQFDEGFNYLEQARQLAKPKTDFHVYVLILLGQLKLASNDREGLRPIQTELYSARPSTMVFFEPIFTDPMKPSLRAKAAVMLLSKRRAAAILRHIFYISGRLFEDVTHRENMMRTPMTLLQNRFGRDVATDEMRRLLPDLCR